MGRKKAFENRATVIVEAANRLFASYGYERTNVEDIAREAGISKASVYLEFKTKADILVQVIELFSAQRIAQLEQQLAHIKPPYLDTLHTVLFDHFMAMFDFAKAHQHSTDSTIHQQIMPFKPGTPPPAFLMQVMPFIETVLVHAHRNQEIPSSVNIAQAAHVIFITLMRLCAPPYPPVLNHAMMSSQLTHLLTLLINGLRYQPEKPKE
jgi:AcrR family transcriptional regulator